jgi:hypothetical protein
MNKLRKAPTAATGIATGTTGEYHKQLRIKFIKPAILFSMSK